MMALQGLPSELVAGASRPRVAGSTPRSSTPSEEEDPTPREGDLRAVPGAGGVPRARARRAREARRLGRPDRARAPAGAAPAPPLGLTAPRLRFDPTRPRLPNVPARDPTPHPRAVAARRGRRRARGHDRGRRRPRRRARRAAAGPVVGTGFLARNARLARLGARTTGGYAVHRARRVFASAERREALDREHEIRSAEQVAAELGNMKGALMKLGQMVSYLDEGLPEHLRGRARPAPARRAADERRARGLDDRDRARASAPRRSSPSGIRSRSRPRRSARCTARSPTKASRSR